MRCQKYLSISLKRNTLKQATKKPLIVRMKMGIRFIKNDHSGVKVVNVAKYLSGLQNPSSSKLNRNPGRAHIYLNEDVLVGQLFVSHPNVNNSKQLTHIRQEFIPLSPRLQAR